MSDDFKEGNERYIVRVGTLYVLEYQTFPSTRKSAVLSDKTAHVFDHQETARSVARDAGGLIQEI